jgi:predicted nuclease with TOPRIM domain
LFLQTLNWRHNPDIEKQINASKLRTKQLRSESEQLRNESLRVRSETEQLKKENARLAASNARLERFEREHLSGLTPHPSTGDSWSS